MSKMLSERAAFVAKRLRAKNSKLLTRQWDRIIDGTVRQLNKHLTDCRDRAETIRHRLLWLDFMADQATIPLIELEPDSPASRLLMSLIDAATQRDVARATTSSTLSA